MKTYSLFVILLVSSSIVFSQNDDLVVAPTENGVVPPAENKLPDVKFTIDLDIRAAFTTGEFKQLYPKVGMGGMGFTVLFPVSTKNPLALGVGFGYYFMSASHSSFSYYTPGTGDYDVDAKVSGSMIPFHIVTRIYPFKSLNFPIQPYIEGLSGFRLFKVTQALTTYIARTDEELPVEKSTDLTGSWSYGYGAGLQFRLSKRELLYLNMKVDQLYGTATKYMDPATVTIYDDGTYEYTNQRSRTNMLRFSLGIHFMID